MTRSAIELPVTADDRRIARLAALAIGLTLAEAAIPSPIPGVKPGLANIVILLVLLQYGWRGDGSAATRARPGSISIRVVPSGPSTETLCAWVRGAVLTTWPAARMTAVAPRSPPHAYTVSAATRPVPASSTPMSPARKIFIVIS
jgi:hypothetical protein